MDLREAANKLNISESTIRRWIKTGKLHANKINGPYGEQYDISDEDIEELKKFNKAPIIVKNESVLPREVLMKMIQESVKEVVVNTLNKVEQSIYLELEDLKRELEETRKQLAAEREKDRAWQEERDRQLMQAIREIQRRQEEALPFWKRWFKR